MGRRAPVVALNRAVAVSFVDGPAAALELVTALDTDPHLAAYPYLPATRADLLRRFGRPDEAAAACREALTMTGNEAERAFLADRILESVAGSGTMGTSPHPPQENS